MHGLIHLKKIRFNQRGFTLTEVLIVIAILAVLAAIIFPNLGSIVGTADVNAANSEADTFRKVVQTYALQTGYVPIGNYGPEPPDGPGLGLLDDYINKRLTGIYTVTSNGTVEGTGGWVGLTWQNGMWVSVEPEPE